MENTNVQQGKPKIFMHVLKCIGRCYSFRGRASKREQTVIGWICLPLIFLPWMLFFALDAFNVLCHAYDCYPSPTLYYQFMSYHRIAIVLVVIFSIPRLAVKFRRIHDFGYDTGWKFWGGQIICLFCSVMFLFGVGLAYIWIPIFMIRTGQGAIYFSSLSWQMTEAFSEVASVYFPMMAVLLASDLVSIIDDGRRDDVNKYGGKDDFSWRL